MDFAFTPISRLSPLSAPFNKPLEGVDNIFFIAASKIQLIFREYLKREKFACLKIEIQRKVLEINNINELHRFIQEIWRDVLKSHQAVDFQLQRLYWCGSGKLIIPIIRAEFDKYVESSFEKSDCRSHVTLVSVLPKSSKTLKEDGSAVRIYENGIHEEITPTERMRDWDGKTIYPYGDNFSVGVDSTLDEDDEYWEGVRTYPNGTIEKGLFSKTLTFCSGTRIKDGVLTYLYPDCIFNKSPKYNFIYTEFAGDLLPTLIEQIDGEPGYYNESQKDYNSKLVDILNIKNPDFNKSKFLDFFGFVERDSPFLDLVKKSTKKPTHEPFDLILFIQYLLKPQETDGGPPSSPPIFSLNPRIVSSLLSMLLDNHSHFLAEINRLAAHVGQAVVEECKLDFEDLGNFHIKEEEFGDSLFDHFAKTKRGANIASSLFKIDPELIHSRKKEGAYLFTGDPFEVKRILFWMEENAIPLFPIEQLVLKTLKKQLTLEEYQMLSLLERISLYQLARSLQLLKFYQTIIFLAQPI